MTSFICMLTEDQVILATDTLATMPDGTPSFYTSKATHIPHLKSLIMGTGAAGFANRWANHIASSMVLLGIYNLDFHTPNALRSLWKDYCNEKNVPVEITTTVYHFGWSDEDSKMCGFAYRSTENFISEALDYGWRYKPECTLVDGDDMGVVIETMMKEQRQIQETRPQSERVFIGGEAILHHIMPSSYTAYNLFRFDDYEQCMQEIIQNYTDC